jgi:hypothetical protein
MSQRQRVVAEAETWLRAHPITIWAESKGAAPIA